MATAELAVRYGDQDVEVWEESSVAEHRRLRTEPFSPAGIDPGEPYAIQRLYLARKGRYGRGRPRPFAEPKHAVSDQAFEVLPTVAFSLSVLGLVAVILALVEREPAYLIPGIVATLVFGILGSVAWYIKTLVRKVKT